MLLKPGMLYNNLILNNIDKMCVLNTKYDIKIEMDKKELKIIFNENIIMVLNTIIKKLKLYFFGYFYFLEIKNYRCIYF